MEIKSLCQTPSRAFEMSNPIAKNSWKFPGVKIKEKGKIVNQTLMFTLLLKSKNVISDGL